MLISKWPVALLAGETVFINGDVETRRDSCYVAKAVQANPLAATTQDKEAVNQVYSVAVGDRTTLNLQFALLRDGLSSQGVAADTQADISKAAPRLDHALSHALRARRV